MTIMANWNNSITVEVQLPYYTQGGTVDFTTAGFRIDMSDVWFSGNDRDSRVWKALVHWGDRMILVIGKTVNTPKRGDQPTTYKVTAWHTFDGIYPAAKWVGKYRGYKTKVLNYD